MAFKYKDMHDAGYVPTSPEVLGGYKKQKKKKIYPTVHLSEKNLKSLKNFDFEDDLTLHIHGQVTGKSTYNDEPADYTIEMQKIGVKHGHNPRAKWMTDADYKKFEKCIKHFKGTGNKYAICASSIKKRKKSNREWISRQMSK